MEPWVMSFMERLGSAKWCGFCRDCAAASRIFSRGEMRDNGSRREKPCRWGGATETMADTLPALLARIHAMTAEPFFREVILRHAAALDLPHAAARFNASIHPRDQMLVHSVHEHRDAGAAFSQYFAIALQQYASARQVM